LCLWRLVYFRNRDLGKRPSARRRHSTPRHSGVSALHLFLIHVGDSQQQDRQSSTASQVPPWTDDPILSAFKFTNVYGASDRFSQFLTREVIYEGDQSIREVFFRVILFKLFNKIETWQLITNALCGPLAGATSLSAVEKVLQKCDSHLAWLLAFQ